MHTVYFGQVYSSITFLFSLFSPTPFQAVFDEFHYADSFRFTFGNVVMWGSSIIFFYVDIQLSQYNLLEETNLFLLNDLGFLIEHQLIRCSDQWTKFIFIFGF
jgi:hypothetical protein